MNVISESLTRQRGLGLFISSLNRRPSHSVSPIFDRVMMLLFTSQSVVGAALGMRLLIINLEILWKWRGLYTFCGIRGICNMHQWLRGLTPLLIRHENLRLPRSFGVLLESFLLFATNGRLFHETSGNAEAFARWSLGPGSILNHGQNLPLCSTGTYLLRWPDLFTVRYRANTQEIVMNSMMNHIISRLMTKITANARTTIRTTTIMTKKIMITKAIRKWKTTLLMTSGA